jgi:hypothetical protein
VPTRDSCTAAKAQLINHLVGDGEQRRRHIKSGFLDGLEVNEKFELHWRLDGKLARFRALENAVDVRRRTWELIDDMSLQRTTPAATSSAGGQ